MKKNSLSSSIHRAYKPTVKSTDQSVRSKLKSRMNLICKKLSSSILNPQPELVYNTPFQFLISVVLSAHSTDKIVNRCMNPYYKKGFDPQTVLKMSTKELENIIKPIGLYKNKARFLKEISKKLIEDFDSKVPSTREELLRLPGVGQKTASVLLVSLFSQPCFPVDTHVFRVSSRLELHPYEKKHLNKVENYLVSITDKKYIKDAHHLFLLHGRYTCTSQKPKCSNCVLSSICNYQQKINK